MTKEKILHEIKRTAKENGGIPLGRDRFLRETGITEYELGKYWPRIGDAHREAGFMPNAFNSAHDENFLIDSFISLIRQLGKIPTIGDMKVKRNSDSNFPDSKSMLTRFGGKEKLLNKILDYSKSKSGYDDIIKLCEAAFEKNKPESLEQDNKEISGTVYLFKHGRHYKIGKTNDTVRRGRELRIQLPENLDLIHEIKTDDPSGIEIYWHKRFESKRMNGEWFDLNSSDVKAFKRWKRIC